jgi:hypothetical protein
MQVTCSALFPANLVGFSNFAVEVLVFPRESETIRFENRYKFYGSTLQIVIK